MPHILHLYKDIFPPVYGGMEVVLGKLAVEQARHGWKVSVAVSGPVDRVWGAEHGVDVISVGEWGRLLSNPISPGFFRLLEKVDYDLLHLHLPCPTAVLATLRKGARDVPWFASYQSDIVRQRMTGALYRPWQRKFLKRCSSIFVSSPPLLSSSEVLASVRERCRIVPLGISPQELSSQEQAAGGNLRADYGGKPIVLFVGRFRWYKGLHVLLEAMDQVDAVLLVVGAGTMRQEQRIRKSINSMKNPERVVLLGPAAHLGPVLAASDLICLPSTHRAEAFGYVLLESFAAGVPAVTTELGTGTSYVNQDGETGLVVPPGDSGSLAEAISRICQNKALRDRFSEAAKTRVRKDFSLDGMVEAILTAYNEAGLKAEG